MTTSLAEQLQKLSVPQSSVYRDDKKRVSLLFTREEAANKDRDTFYEIGVSGLNSLISLYEGFRFFEDTLFSLSSKDFERAVQSKKANENLDKTIEKFLRQLSPYFQLQAAHKALEWLINRYHIHQYNQDAIMGLILPYHETKIFVRFIQIMDIKANTNRWNWLLPLQKPGVPLARQVLYNRCASDISLLNFIAKNTRKYVKDFGERASKLNALYAFFCSATIGAIDASKRISESLVTALLPTIIKALVSPVDDFRSSGYIIIGYMCSKMQLKGETLNEIIAKILNSEFSLSYDMVILVNLIYSTQSNLQTVSEDVLYDISVDRLLELCVHLKKLISQKISIMQFVLKFLKSVLALVQKNMEEFKRMCKLPEILIGDIDFSTQSPEDLIKCVLASFNPSTYEDGNGYESDVEIIDEDKVVSNDMTDWYSVLLKTLELKYPDAFDKVIMSEFNAKKAMTVQKHAQLSKILGFKPAIIHKIGSSYLFEYLNHSNPRLRIEAVKYIAKEFSSLKSEDVCFVKESIINRYKDDDADVVMTVLKIPIQYIEEILTPDELTNCFIVIVTKTVQNHKKWLKVVKDAIDVFCSLDSLKVNQETVLALLPYMFPNNVKSAAVAYDIINSAWGKRFTLAKLAGARINNQKTSEGATLPEIIRESVFSALEQAEWGKEFAFEDYSNIDKNNTVNVCLYLFLKSHIFQNASIEECTQFLKDIVDFVASREIVLHSECFTLSGEVLMESIKLCSEDRILFPMIEYLFTKVINHCHLNNISKPWYNVCNSTQAMFLRQVFEICVTGCALPDYSSAYCSLLQKLLNKICSNTREKLEFVANFTCGHILFAEKPEGIISPELQLRSLKLLRDCIQHMDDMPWIFDSNIPVALLFALNNPLAVIRQCAIGGIQMIVDKNRGSTHYFNVLLNELLSRKNEILLDHEQILQMLYLLMSQDKLVLSGLNKNTQVKMSQCLNKLLELVTDAKTPAYVSSELLSLLAYINSPDIFSRISAVASQLLHHGKTHYNNKPAHLDVYESKLLRNIYARINEKTVKSFSLDPVWEMIVSGLKQYKEIIIDEYESFVSPCILILKQIEADSFSSLSKSRAVEFTAHICSVGTFSNNPDIVSVAAKLMKKIDLRIDHFKVILNSMLNVKDPGAEKIKKRLSNAITMISHRTAETDEWKLGVTMLEYIQNKKKLQFDDTFMPLLFKLLQKCLEFEEQSYVEYTKQLLLSSIWFYCQKFVSSQHFIGSNKELKTIKAGFEIELIVKCIRGTQNPQTHHHALMLLSQAAHILPEQVLNHTMAIFTFIGSSVLRHDDQYSFQIIIKIIETIVPILVKLDSFSEYSNEKGLQQLQARVVPVLRIFADVVLDVPEHRRLLLYKKLIETLGPSHFLWVFIALLLETHLCHWNDSKGKHPNPSRSLAEQELPINRMDFGQSLILEFPADIVLENYIKLIGYLKTLPIQKDENMMETDVNPADIFSVNGHSGLQLRHYKYTIVTFMNTCLSSPYFIQHSHSVSDTVDMEKLYKTFIINTLMFIQSVSKVRDETDGKYWKVMLHHSYDLLDNVNNLLSAPMFVSVVRGLLAHTLHTVRRKAMELLNSKIQYSPEMFKECDKELLYSLLPALIEILKTLDTQAEVIPENIAQKIELNQQMALLSLKLMTRMLAAENPVPFKPILEKITEYTCNSNITGNVMASIVLCLAELCSNLKAHAIASLPKFMPALINVLKSQRKVETPELVMLSSITAVCKVVESLPLFLSPYLKKILYEYSILLARWQMLDQECSKVSAVVSKLTNIKKKIASSIAPRVLIPVTSQCYQMHINKGKLDAVGPVMAVLAESFAHITTADFTALQQELTTFFLSALQLRSDSVGSDPNIVDKAEDEIINALVCLVLKLSETSFRPFYFKIYDWAIRTNVDNEKDRAITFYRLSSAIAEKLKGLFVLFAGHFIQNASQLLDHCNKSKTDELYFDSEEKCGLLVESILKTLQIVFLYDSQNFVNKDRFETLMQPIVDQLENTLGGIPALKQRCEKLLWPCISQFAVAIADDSLWKPLNYQILLKTRHNDAEIRLVALECAVSAATQLGSGWLPLLAEAVPFLAELLEDGDARIETAAQDAVRRLEAALGEPLQKYF